MEGKGFLNGRFKLKENKGFTLIELLVVIAIIGILASIIFVAMDGAKSRARDARRKSDIRQLSLALEMYSEANGHFPIKTTAINSSAGLSWFPELATYMASQPVDPLNESNYFYFYKSNGTGLKYEVDSMMEVDTAAAAADSGNNSAYYEFGNDTSVLSGATPPT